MGRLRGRGKQRRQLFPDELRVDLRSDWPRLSWGVTLLYAKTGPGETEEASFEEGPIQVVDV